MRTRILSAAAPVFAAALAIACGSSSANRDEFQEPGSSGGASGGPMSSGNIGGGSNGMPGPAPACATAEANTIKPPVDFIFSIDQSGSMSEETASLQQNVNGLATLLKNSGLDYRVVMIAGKSGQFPICVPPPLGGAGCTSNDPIFRAVDQHIESWDSLKWIVDTFKQNGGPRAWRDFLREEALKVFIPITDDRSEEMTPQVFDANMLSLGGKQFGDDKKRNYVMYPIIGNQPYPSEAMCSSAAASGTEYITLAKMTGGKWFSVCSANFKDVFDEIGKTVNAAVACELAIPEVEGQTLDPDRVNVKIKDKDGKIVDELKKGCVDAKGKPLDGWDYSEDGTRIVLCNGSCEQVKQNPEFKTTVEFGCETKVQ